MAQKLKICIISQFTHWAYIHMNCPPIWRTTTRPTRKDDEMLRSVRRNNDEQKKNKRKKTHLTVYTRAQDNTREVCVCVFCFVRRREKRAARPRFIRVYWKNASPPNEAIFAKEDRKLKPKRNSNDYDTGSVCLPAYEHNTRWKQTAQQFEPARPTREEAYTTSSSLHTHTHVVAYSHTKQHTHTDTAAAQKSTKQIPPHANQSQKPQYI